MTRITEPRPDVHDDMGITGLDHRLEVLAAQTPYLPTPTFTWLDLFERGLVTVAEVVDEVAEQHGLSVCCDRHEAGACPTWCAEAYAA